MNYDEYLKQDEKIAEEVFNLCNSYVVDDKLNPPVVLATVLNSILNLIKETAPNEEMAKKLIIELLAFHDFDVSPKKK